MSALLVYKEQLKKGDDAVTVHILFAQCPEGNKARNGTSPAAGPAIMETGAVPPLQKLKKLPLTSGHLRRI